jgi:hypothetical protein
LNGEMCMVMTAIMAMTRPHSILEILITMQQKYVRS